MAMRHHLRELSLKENRLEKVPPEILPLASLTSLSLASNQISSIDEDVFSHLKHLQWLSLSCNELVTLPDDLIDCRKLKGLDIHSNNFKGLLLQLHCKLQVLSCLHECRYSFCNTRVKKPADSIGTEKPAPRHHTRFHIPG